MKTYLLSFLATVLTLGSARAQLVPAIPYSPLAQVKQFLQLNDSQVQTILANNEDYNRWSSDKQARIRQVQGELADETRKSPLDPNALGIRYAEIETICREIAEKAASSQQQNLSVLTGDQKSKLNILTDAIKLAPVISEAQYGNLIPGSSVPYGFSSGSIAYAGNGLVSGLLGPAYGCSSPFPGNIIPASRVSGTAPVANRNTSHWFDTTKFVALPDRKIQE